MRYEIDQSIALSQSLGGDSDWKALMTPINLKRAIISTLPLTFQNVVGVPLMFCYTTYFFSMANVEDPFLGKIVINAILLVGIILSFYMVDKVGRRTLFLGGGFGMMVICFIVGGLGFMQPTSASGPVLIALCGIWAFLYANSLAPIGEPVFSLTFWNRSNADISRMDLTCRGLKSKVEGKDNFTSCNRSVHHGYHFCMS